MKIIVGRITFPCTKAWDSFSYCWFIVKYLAASSFECSVEASVVKELAREALLEGGKNWRKLVLIIWITLNYLWIYGPHLVILYFPFNILVNIKDFVSVSMKRIIPLVLYLVHIWFKYYKAFVSQNELSSAYPNFISWNCEELATKPHRICQTMSERLLMFHSGEKKIQSLR